MKRVEKFWGLTCLGKSGRKHIAPGHIYWTRESARHAAIDGQAVVRVSIAFDDGDSPKWDGKEDAGT